MKSPKQIAKKFNDYMARTDDLNIEGWSLQSYEGQSISIGIDDNHLGGPYTPPSGKTACAGSAYIIWGDGTISSAGLTPDALEDIDAALKRWKESSYTDADAPEIQEPSPLPRDLKIKDDNVIKLIKDDSSYLFEILEYYTKELEKKSYVKELKAKVGATLKHVNIMNSKGLDVEWDDTLMTTYAYINNKYSDSYCKRKMPDKNDIDKILKELDREMSSKKDIILVKSGNMPLIFAPDIFGNFLGKYLIDSNLSGGAVAHDMSLYGIKDFKEKRKVFDERFNLIIDGLEEYAARTVPCSSAGTPSSKQYIIADGRLITPFASVKNAKKLGITPTSEGEVKLDIATRDSYQSLIENTKYGLVIKGVLGMHTQDAKEGRYSMTAYDGNVIKDGKIIGIFEPVVISGNFFDALNDKETMYAEYREDDIVMKTYGSVQGK